MNCPSVRLTIVTGAAAILCVAVGHSAAAPPLPGAIFTTTEDGTIVNENVKYNSKEEVYLDGGPGPNAPAGAAGLPEGDYYFQVTDPSGQDLLSSDHISCRRIHVNEFGVIDFVYAGMNLEKIQGTWTCVDCQHEQGVDVDHDELGAITVQLFPYDDTPNPGGVYKVWITPVEDYAGDDSECEVHPCAGEHGSCNVNGENWQPGNFHGFIPSKSKTDNFKVKKQGPPCPPSEISVRKFHDENLNCIQDEGEEDVTGWAVEVTDPLDVTNTEFTPETILAGVPGIYTFVEDTPDGTLQTTSILDGMSVSCYPTADPTVMVLVVEECEETHEVVYGNVGLGSVTACKVYDRDADGMADEDEPGVAGWQMCLTGVTVLGDPVGPICQFTGEDGCTTFGDLLPGSYTVTEIIPETGGWEPTGPTSFDVVIESSIDGSTVIGTQVTVTFTNICFGEADFDTKGYWHNKNGLIEMTQADIDYVNTLDPYDDPTDYFDDGDEPFDGFFENGDPVDAAIGDGIWQGEEIAPAGTPKAEVSQFLVDQNAGGDPREQLAQQLLAFIFNSLHNLDDPCAVIELPDGTLITACDLIDAAIAIWQSGSPQEQTDMQELLNSLNNNDAVPVVFFNPCEVVYP